MEHLPVGMGRDAIWRLCSWIEVHIGDFLPVAGTSLPRSRHVKPLAELSLVLWALTQGAADDGRLRSWALRMVDLLRPAIAGLGKSLSCSSSGSDRIPLELLIVLCIFERLTDQEVNFHEAVAAALCREGDTLQFAFARDLSGLGHCGMLARDTLDLSRSAWQGNPKRSALYTITHSIFFATLFGTRNANLSVSQCCFLESVFSSSIMSRLEQGDFDIAAELLAAMAWSGFSAIPSFAEGSRMLASVALSQGSFPSEAGKSGEANTFDDRYHATIISLAALAGALPCLEEG